MSDNKIEIQVCLKIIKAEMEKLSAYPIVDIAKEMYKNSAHLNDNDFVEGQLIIENIITVKNRKGSESNDCKEE